MRKILLVIGLIFGSFQFSQAQFIHGIGMTASGLFGRISKYSAFGGSSYDFSMSQFSFAYFPRYNFVENDNSSVSVGAPVALGAGIASNSYSGDASFYFAYEVPVVLDYNIGLKSTEDNDNGFGGYIGAGFSYYHVGMSESMSADFNGTTYGPLLRGGVRFHIPSKNDDPKVMSLGIFYKKGMESTKLTTIGFNLIVDL